VLDLEERRVGRDPTIIKHGKLSFDCFLDRAGIRVQGGKNQPAADIEARVASAREAEWAAQAEYERISQGRPNESRETGARRVTMPPSYGSASSDHGQRAVSSSGHAALSGREGPGSGQGARREVQHAHTPLPSLPEATGPVPPNRPAVMGGD
jgi:hypothetical protein